MKFSICLLTTLCAVVKADLRIASKPYMKDFEIQQDGVPFNYLADGTQVSEGDDVGVLRYMEPSTFGHKELDDQKENTRDNFLRSNTDNEANQRDV